MNNVTNCHEKLWSPNIRVQTFVKCLFQNGGNMEQAERESGYSKRGWYRHIKKPLFVAWYSRKVDEHIRGMLVKAAQTLENAMDSENRVAGVAAAKVIFQLAGKLQINSSANIEKEPALPVTLINQFNQYNQVNISREDFTTLIEHCEAVGVPRAEIEEVKALMDAADGAEYTTRGYGGCRRG